MTEPTTPELSAERWAPLIGAFEDFAGLPKQKQRAVLISMAADACRHGGPETGKLFIDQLNRFVGLTKKEQRWALEILRERLTG